MNRKKITKAALSGLVAVTMVPAMAAPLVANAEGNDATEEELLTRKVTINYVTEAGESVGTISDYTFKDLDVDNSWTINATEIPSLPGYEIVTRGDLLSLYGDSNITVQVASTNVKMNIRFVDENGTFISGGDYFLPEGVQNYSILEQYVPEGYKMTVSGDFTVVEGGSEKVTVESIYEGTTLSFVFVDANGKNLGGGDVIVDADKDGIFNWSEVKGIVPAGYELTLSGDQFVADYIGGTNTITVNKVYTSTIVNVQFVDENGTVVGGGDYFVDEDGDGIFSASELDLPAGYELNGGGDYFVTEQNITIPVTKIAKGTIINVVFKDPQGNNLGGGDYIVDVDGDGIANYSELDLPLGYKLNETGDFFVEEGGHYTVVLNRAGAAIIHVVFKSEGGKNLGGGDYFVDEDGDGIFNYSELTLPEGYELIVTGDEFVDTEKTYEIVLNKEIEGTIINVVYVDEEGNNLGGGDFFVDPDDDGIANYSELDLPEGYELIVTGDFFVTPGKSYTITLHKITEEETAAATLVVRYVDQDNGNEVVLEKTYDDQVGPVGEVATYTEDVVVPEGYKLVQDIKGIAADVEYGQTKVMYVFVTKTAEEPTQPGDEDKPNTPAKEETTEESEKTDGTNTGVAMSLAGVFGTMSAALAGMVALLRRKQK